MGFTDGHLVRMEDARHFMTFCFLGNNLTFSHTRYHHSGIVQTEASKDPWGYSNSMDPPFSDIDFRNEMAWVWTILENYLWTCFENCEFCTWQFYYPIKIILNVYRWIIFSLQMKMLKMSFQIVHHQSTEF